MTPRHEHHTDGAHDHGPHEAELHTHDHHAGGDPGHDHNHGHHHSHVPADFGRAFAIGTALNLGFVLIEAGYGFYANSIALLADAGHNLSDVAGLVLAWGASALVKRPPTARYTYGLGATTILAALANAVLLLVAVGAILWEAAGRIFNPEPVASGIMMAVAALGILINGATAWLFHAGRHADINVRGAFLHMAADAIVSVGVVLTGLAIAITGRVWLDPLISIIIALVIVWGTWGLLKESLHMAAAGVPPGIDAAHVRGALLRLPGVTDVHDLHIWPVSTTSSALTAHLAIPSGYPGDAFLSEAGGMLKSRFGIAHATLQIEVGDGTDCAVRCDAPAQSELALK